MLLCGTVAMFVAAQPLFLLLLAGDAIQKVAWLALVAVSALRATARHLPAFRRSRRHAGPYLAVIAALATTAVLVVRRRIKPIDTTADGLVDPPRS